MRFWQRPLDLAAGSHTQTPAGRGRTAGWRGRRERLEGRWGNGRKGKHLGRGRGGQSAFHRAGRPRDPLPTLSSTKCARAYTQTHSHKHIAPGWIASPPVGLCTSFIPYTHTHTSTYITRFQSGTPFL